MAPDPWPAGRIPPGRRPGGTAAMVSFHPADLPNGRAGAAGVVDYRLARRGLISEFRKGRLSASDVCDAHPELLRAAESYSRPTSEPCPICDDAPLVLVTYVFGAQLPASGRCVATLEELVRLAARAPSGRAYRVYVVEVCAACHWNHLVQIFPLAAAGASL